jgi:NAD-dependent SIR2 family protein deacetylase
MRLAKLIQSSKNTVVMVGAGISTAAGIPDFRTPGTGLYSQLKKYKLPYPEAIFEMSFFEKNPDPFYSLCREIWPSSYAPTRTHHFLAMMRDRRLVRRVFTQNIDSLERLAGLDADSIVAAHGNFDTATCIRTKKQVPIDDVERAVKGEMTWQALHEKHDVQRVKPDIVFFGEALPRRFSQQSREDMPTCDLLIIIGTSLQVHPFAGLVEDVPDTTPRFLINRDRVRGPFQFRDDGNGRDVFIQGDADSVIEVVAKELGWRDELLERHAKGKAKVSENGMKAKV